MHWRTGSLSTQQGHNRKGEKDLQRVVFALRAGSRERLRQGHILPSDAMLPACQHSAAYLPLQPPHTVRSSRPSRQIGGHHRKHLKKLLKLPPQPPRRLPRPLHRRRQGKGQDPTAERSGVPEPGAP